MFNVILLRAGLLIALAGIAVTGDSLLNKVSSPLFRAVIDNFTHALIGAMAWIIGVTKHLADFKKRSFILEVLLCFFMSSLIDLDHFFAAKSLTLKDATNLISRPILHCSTLFLVIGVIVIGSVFWKKLKRIGNTACILFTAMITHHIRDASRRGFWFCGFGYTNAISYWMYIAMILSTPVFPAAFMYTQDVLLTKQHVRQLGNHSTLIGSADSIA